MTFPDFPSCRLLDFCIEESETRNVNGGTLYNAGFPVVLLRMFLSQEMHKWCETELEFYTWTMQYVWFNSVEDRTKFIQRWLYPSWLLWQHDHAYGIQIDMPGGDDVINQMNALGAKFDPTDLTRFHMFRAPTAGMMQDFSDGEYPPKDAAWIGAGYDQAMIGKMCGLEVIKTPPLRELGVNPDTISVQDAIASRDRRLLGVYGITLPERLRKNRDPKE